MDSKNEFIKKDKNNKNVFLYNEFRINREKTEISIREMNQNSNLGFDLLHLYNENIRKNTPKEWGNGQWIDNYTSIDFNCDGISYIFSGYPHDEVDDYFLTEINFSSNKFNIFGIKPGNDIFNSENILINLGFEKVNHYFMDWVENVYKKNDLYILLLAEYDSKINISSINVKVETYNLGNRIY